MHQLNYYNRREIPAYVRMKVLFRAKGHCEDCGKKNSYLELHHLTYDRPVQCKRDIGEPIFGYETENELEALCRTCHYQRHILPNGVFEADIDEVNSWRGW